MDMHVINWPLYIWSLIGLLVIVLVGTALVKEFLKKQNRHLHWIKDTPHKDRGKIKADSGI